MRAAVGEQAAADLKLLAVTVLTSLAGDLDEYGLQLRGLRPGGAARAPSHGGRLGWIVASPVEAAPFEGSWGPRRFW